MSRANETVLDIHGEIKTVVDLLSSVKGNESLVAILNQWNTRTMEAHNREIAYYKKTVSQLVYWLKNCDSSHMSDDARKECAAAIELADEAIK